MCFFKPKMPQQPTPPVRPTITETKAPEPEALAVGGSDVSTAEEGTKKTKGTGSLKIDMKESDTSESGDANINSGANQSFNSSAGTKPRKALVKNTSKAYVAPKKAIIS